MRIHILRKMEYKGCPIHALQFGHIFQYLFVYKNEIYMDYIVATPAIPSRISAWVVGKIKKKPTVPYSKDVLDELEGTILNSAFKSIDELKKKKK